MVEFVKSQYDYFVFLSGLCYIAFGVLTYFIYLKEKGNTVRLPWFYLGMFSIFHGLNEWLGIYEYHYGDHVQILAAVIITLSVLALFEFARRGSETFISRTPGRWIYSILIIITLFGIYFAHKLDAIPSNFLIGTCATIWASVNCYRFSKLIPARSRPLLALSVLLLSFLLIIGAKAALLNDYALKVSELILGSFWFLAAWNYLYLTMREELFFIKSIQKGIFFPLVTMFMAITVVFGWGAFIHLSKYAEDSLRSDFLHITQTAGASINVERVENLNLTPADSLNPDFKRIREQLRAILKVNPECQFAYLMGLKSGKVIFMADAEDECSEYYSPPGKIYQNSSQELYQIFQDAKPFVEGPVHDEWGTWISAHCALVDAKTDKVVAVLGMDVDAKKWAQKVLKYRLIVMGLVLFFFIIVVAVLAGMAVRENEKRYFNLILDGVSEMVVLLRVEQGPNFRMISVNDVAALSSAQNVKQMVGRLVTDIFPKKMAEDINNRCIHALEHGELVYEEPTGKQIFLSKLVPVLDSSGKVSHLIYTALDITAKKKMEEDLLKVQKLESVGLLAGGIAHDFNNILTVIMGNVSLTKFYCSNDEKVCQLLTEIETASAQARNLTQQLLTFAKGGGLRTKTASIKELVHETVGFTLRGSNVKSDLQFPEDLWPAEIDEGQIGQVFNNLIINAKQAMSEGGILSIRAENYSVDETGELPIKPGNYLKITVSDTGVGIPTESLSKVFDPYFTTKQTGSGLGLATTYSIISKHGGYISVDSQPGLGTQFYIYLPASPEKLLPSEDKGNQQKPPIQGKGYVLVMDDETLVRRVVTEMLNSLGYEVAAASDGAKAVDMYKQAYESGQPFDVVIMDLTVPGGMGGKEAMALLKELDPEVKGIVSSGYSTDAVMSNHNKYGFAGVVAKPYLLAELDEAVKQVMTTK